MSAFADSLLGRLVCRLCRGAEAKTNLEDPSGISVNKTPEATVDAALSPQLAVLEANIAEAQEEAHSEPYEIVFFIDPETLLRTDPPAKPGAPITPR